MFLAVALKKAPLVARKRALQKLLLAVKRRLPKGAVVPGKDKAPGQPDSGEQTPQPAPESPAEAPRRIHRPKRRYGDKQLRPDRVRGGFDTKGGRES